MKKIALMLLVLALLLGSVSALAVSPWDSTNCAPAGNMPPLVDTSKPSKVVHAYKNWVPNLAYGSHSCDGLTVACSFEFFTLDGVVMYVCPVCGNLNGETVVPEVKSHYLQVNRVKPKKNPNPPYKWSTAGMYTVRAMRMPDDCSAAYLITTCHEIAGVTYDAETLYNFILPIDGRNMTLKKAYFGGLTDFAGSINAGVNGLQIRPTKQSSCFGAFLLMK